MTVLERVPTDRIMAQARQVHVGRALLALLLGVFYAVGWLASRAGLALAVVGTSVKLGWQDARKPAGAVRGPA
jgi:hypothetical protein